MTLFGWLQTAMSLIVFHDFQKMRNTHHRIVTFPPTGGRSRTILSARSRVPRAKQHSTNMICLPLGSIREALAYHLEAFAYHWESICLPFGSSRFPFWKHLFTILKHLLTIRKAYHPVYGISVYFYHYLSPQRGRGRITLAMPRRCPCVCGGGPAQLCPVVHSSYSCLCYFHSVPCIWCTSLCYVVNVFALVFMCFS